MNSQQNIILLVICLVFCGDAAMARQRYVINKDKYDAVMNSIGYESLIQTMSEEKPVLVNWSTVFDEFIDGEGKKWNAVSKPDVSLGSSYGTFRLNIVSNDLRMSVTLYSYANGRPVAIEQAVRMATNNSAPFIGYKHADSCLSDFCLVSTVGQNNNSMFFVYEHVLVWLSYHDADRSVMPVARYLRDLMESAVRQNPEGKLPARPKFRYRVDTDPVIVNEPFTVTAMPDSDYDSSTWRFDPTYKQPSAFVEFKKDLGGNEFLFIAKKPGQHSVTFNLMDKRTLWVFVDTVNIDVQPEK